LPQQGPSGPFGFSGDPNDEAKPATRKSITQATASKTSPTKVSPKLPTAAPHNGADLIVLGLDEQQKPRGARFEKASLDLVTKAADAMGLKVYQANASEVVDIAKKLPLGRLYAAGRGFVPNIDRISTAILLWPWL
jgi:hypothetical protein